MHSETTARHFRVLSSENALPGSVRQYWYQAVKMALAEIPRMSCRTVTAGLESSPTQHHCFDPGTATRISSGMPCRYGGSAWQSRNPLNRAITHRVLCGSHALPNRFVLAQRARCLHDLENFPERTPHAKLSDSSADGAYDSNAVRVQGLVRSIRKQKKRAFAHISDGTTYEPIQAVIRPDKAER